MSLFAEKDPSMPHIHILKISRLESLMDGIFAIAMTILVLDLHLPPELSMKNMPHFLTHEAMTRLIIYIGSFIILGTLWIAMSFQLGLLERLNRTYLWCNVFYLMAVCVVPFSASLLGAYPESYASVTFYACNLLCVSLGQFIVAQCAHYYDLNNDFFPNAVRIAILKRIGVAPVFYVASLIVAHWNIKAAFFLLIAPTIIYMKPGRVDKFESTGHDR